MGSITQTDFGYTGQRSLANIGLSDFKARFYDASIGRFIQPDTIVSNPVNPQTWNRYSYVSNNPINRTDPSGHCVVGGHEMDDSSSACQYKSPAAPPTTTKPPLTGPLESEENKQRRLKHEKEMQDALNNLEAQQAACQYSPTSGCFWTGSPSNESGGMEPIPEGLNPYNADYTSSTISIGGAVGFTGTWTVDRYGQEFLSAGITAGKSLTFISVSHMEGWIGDEHARSDGIMPREYESESYFTGPAANITGSVFVNAAGETFSPLNLQHSQEKGVASPQIGGSVTYGWKQTLADFMQGVMNNLAIYEANGG